MPFFRELRCGILDGLPHPKIHYIPSHAIAAFNLTCMLFQLPPPFHFSDLVGETRDLSAPLCHLSFFLSSIQTLGGPLPQIPLRTPSIHQSYPSTSHLQTRLTR